MDFDIKFEGLDGIIKKIDKIDDVKSLTSAMYDVCDLVESSAKDKAPKDTGALRRSIQSKVEVTGNEIDGIVFTPLEYAPYIEYGTGLYAENGNGRQTPWVYRDDKGKYHYTKGYKGTTGHGTPYMRPALNENKDEIIQIIKEALG